MSTRNNATIKIIPTIITPSRYKNNFNIKTNNSAFNLNPEYILRNEKSPSPTLMLQYANNNSNNMNYEYYQINNNESDIDDNGSKNLYLNKRTNRTISSNEGYPSNYSYYESKYSKKVLNPAQTQNKNFTINTHKVLNSNTHNLKYNSNEKIQAYNKEIKDALLQNLNRSHILSPKSFTKDEFNNNTSSNKKPMDIFYSKVPQNKVNYFQKTSQNNPKKNPNIIIYKDYYKNSKSTSNPTNNKIPPKTPKVNSQYKVGSHDENYVLINQNQSFHKIENKTMKNLHNINSKSLENNAFKNQLINFQNEYKNIYNNNSYKENNFKKVIKYSSKTNINQENVKNNTNIVEPFRLSGDNKNNKFNSNNNNNVNSTIVNITYINENKNYIKNIFIHKIH